MSLSQQERDAVEAEVAVRLDVSSHMRSMADVTRDLMPGEWSGLYEACVAEVKRIRGALDTAGLLAGINRGLDRMGDDDD